MQPGPHAIKVEFFVEFLYSKKLNGFGQIFTTDRSHSCGGGVEGIIDLSDNYVTTTWK